MMSIYEAMADGLCGFFRMSSKRGRCLDTALKLIEKDPSLKLMMGPKGSDIPEDTAHFWVETQDGEIIDNAADTVWEDYAYEGREVNPEAVLEELAEGYDRITKETEPPPRPR